MKALRWWGRGDVRVDKVPYPELPGEGWVLVEVEACGICGTDVEEYTHGPIVSPLEPHPLTGAQVPITMGHEIVGTIIESNAKDAPPIGTRVIVEGNRYCGRCFWCKQGEYPLCEILGSLGQMADGGLAEFVVAPAYMCLPLPANLSSEQATVIEPLGVVLRAFKRRMVIENHSLVVFGAGTLGLLAMQVAKVQGAGDVVVVDPIARRRELALSLGADLVLAPDQIDQLESRYPGDGPDNTLECAGVTSAAEAAVKTVRRGGTAVLIGVHDAPICLNMLDLVLSEKTITTSVSHTWDVDIPAAIEMMASGTINADALITSVIPLTRTISEGFDRILDKTTDQIKVVVVPDKRFKS